jgi:hypothetical protein
MSEPAACLEHTLAKGRLRAAFKLAETHDGRMLRSWGTYEPTTRRPANIARRLRPPASRWQGNVWKL